MLDLVGSDHVHVILDLAGSADVMLDPRGFDHVMLDLGGFLVLGDLGSRV